MKKKIYQLLPEHDGQTIAAALKSLSPDCTWGKAKKWIANRHIEINGTLCLDEARRVSDGDTVHVWEQPLAKQVGATAIKIVHLDEYLAVVEKPAGLTTVRHFAERRISTRRRQLQPTLEELLPPILAKEQGFRWPPLPPEGMNRGRRHTNQMVGREKPGHILNAKKLPPELQVFAVHRLDRDTSGLMLFARSREAEQKLMKLFKRHAVQREYVAVCNGLIEPQVFESYLVRDRGDGVRGSLPPDADEAARAKSKKAKTHVLTSEPLGKSGFSLIRCRLETGRTHQIRIHLAEAGHPICGDKIYGVKTDDDASTDSGRAEPPRQLLHSDRIEFPHPFTDEKMQFEMDIPKDMNRWIESKRGA